MMEVFCAECGVFMHEKPGLGENGPSHGLCDLCFDARMEELDAEGFPPEDAELCHALDGTAPEVEELDLSRFRRLFPIRREHEEGST